MRISAKTLNALNVLKELQDEQHSTITCTDYARRYYKSKVLTGAMVSQAQGYLSRLSDAGLVRKYGAGAEARYKVSKFGLVFINNEGYSK